MTGFKFGRFTVVGMALNTPHRWVVRCICGIYTMRKLKSIRNPNNNQDRCERCRQLAYLKRSDLRRQGIDTDKISWGDL